MNNKVNPEQRIVITGIGLTSPNGNNLKEFRESLLTGKSGVQKPKDHKSSGQMGDYEYP